MVLHIILKTLGPLQTALSLSDHPAVSQAIFHPSALMGTAELLKIVSF